MTNHQRIDIGPNKHLSPQDWNEMLQFFRNRRVFIFAGLRATGYGNPDAVVDMARNSPDANTVPGLAVDGYHAIVAPDAADGTRTNLFQQDATAGQAQLVQQNTAAGTVYTTGVLAPLYSGAGVPTATSLATGAYYRVQDRYLDTATNLEYICTTAGDKTASVWAQLGAAGSGSGVWL